MIRSLMTAMVSGAAFVGVAAAQAFGPSAVTTNNFVQYCKSFAAGQLANPDVPCACGAGFMGAFLTEPQYVLAGEMLPYMNDEKALENYMIAAVNAGRTTPQELFDVALGFQNAAPGINRVCTTLEQQRSLSNAVSLHQGRVAPQGLNSPGAKTVPLGAMMASAGQKVRALAPAVRD